MIMLKRLWILILLGGLAQVFGQQSTDFLIIEAPIGARPATSVMWVKWTGGLRSNPKPTFIAPDSGVIFYSRSPGGGVISNYRNQVTVPWVDTASGDKMANWLFHEIPPRRGTAFKPIDQTDMRSGVFYCVVALVLPEDTLVSNEFPIYVESPDAVDWTGPNGTITELTPVFSWKATAGVPYYHVILSDEALKVDKTSGNASLEGLSIIWQAITQHTQIVYGAPDPSKTITADPPPLSPGQRYTWIVLNNYGNFPGLSSPRIEVPYGEFTVAGEQLKKPKSVYPVEVDLTSLVNESFEFKWTNLDTNANTYKVYLYVSSDFEGINAKMTVWQTEVAAARVDTLKVKINAASVLTSNRYSWRVIAVDDQGAGSAGDTAGFYYSAPTGHLSIYTREHIVVPRTSSAGFDTVTANVGLVKMEVEVLGGSMEAPLLFYTDDKGKLERTRPAGTYRITAVKDGFERFTKTISLPESSTVVDTFFLVRPEAIIFGKVVDESNKGINLARVVGLSDRGDTLSTSTDALGNFIFNCYAADWTITGENIGYKSSVPRKITSMSGESFNAGSIILEKNPHTLSGVVNNTAGNPLLGVKVRLLREGVLVDEVPSTPQAGTFTFTIPTGTYTLTADKSGFTSYSSAIDVLSSKSVTVALAPGATIVTGYVYGESWVGDDKKVAPITGARVLFLKAGVSGAVDTFATVSDAVYGDYRISLAGGQRYGVHSSAPGFAVKATAKVCTTIAKTTQTVHDTLRALGSITGYAKLAASGAAASNVNINLIMGGDAVAAGKSSTNGYFEIRNLVDGTYVLRAGREGLVLDSVAGGDTVIIAAGRSSKPEGALLYMKPGDKTIKFHVISVDSFKGSIKVQSPILKTIAHTDSLRLVGPGAYIVSVDASADSLVDLAYHQFLVQDTAVAFTDSVRMTVMHQRVATLNPKNGLISLQLTSADTLDSAIVYYRDEKTPQFISLKKDSADTRFTFSFAAPRDGSRMYYYFVAHRGSDRYGYDKEVYNSYISADTSRLSRYEITPSSSDTLLLPSGYEARFSFKGYYSSVYLRDTTIDSTSISWQLVNPQGCAIVKSAIGTRVTVRTASSRLYDNAVGLKVSIDTAKTKLAAQVALSDTIWFRVSGSTLVSMTIRRIDGKSPNPISTSPTERAEFRADGYDSKGSILAVSPSWSIKPAQAGIIDVEGVFRPDRHFVGFVRIFASAGGTISEFNPKLSRDAKEEGLNVTFMVREKSKPDTANNFRGCRIVMPAGVVSGSDFGMLELSIPDIRNQIKRGITGVRMVDSLAYEITEIEDATLNLSNDSIRLLLDIPTQLRSQAVSDKARFKVALWNQDSLMWEPLDNSVVSSDGAYVSAAIAHFSRYAVVAEPGAFGGKMEVKPNPFTPYYRPLGPGTPQGTCISFSATSRELMLQTVRVRIYNLVGDLVWALEIRNARSDYLYNVWWNGRTTEGEAIWDGSRTDEPVVVKGSKMCRNGRYFAVLTLKDMNSKQLQYMKPVVLMK